jgi:hypothetical protein
MVKLKEKPVKKPTDRILIKGLVTVWQGEGKDKKILVRKAENHWVDQGLRGLLSALVLNYVRHPQYGPDFLIWVYNPAMYLGQDTATLTTHGMTALVTPIGAAPGTGPNSISGADRTNPATGEWRTSLTAIWYSGTISGTVGEMALYLRPFTNITFRWTSDGGTLNSLMVSRLSAADGDFTSFAIDTTKSLTVQWEIVITFA